MATYFTNRTRFIKTIVVLVIATVGCLASYAALVISAGTAQPLMIVGSSSMEPSIRTGTLTVVRATDPSQIHLGNIIVYQKALSSIRIIHRVVCIVTSSSSQCTSPWYVFITCGTPPCYYTKGDNNQAPDPWSVLSDEIVGVFTGYGVPYLGMTLFCLRQGPECPSPWGPLSVVVLGGAVASDITLEYFLLRRSKNIEAYQKSKEGLSHGST